MTYLVTVTSQGQISIPAKLRRDLGLDNKKVLVSKENDKLVIEATRDFMELEGSLKTNKRPLTNLELDEIVGQAVADEYAEKLKRSK